MSALLDALQPPGGVPVELDAADPRVRALLADVPANLLKGHGQVFTRFRFVRFRDRAGGRRWAAEVGRTVTVAAERPVVTVALSFTAAGLRQLGCLDRVPVVLRGGRDPFREGLLTPRHAVRGGRAGELLGDGAEEWEPAYRQELHALLAVSFDESARAEAERFWAAALARPELDLGGGVGPATPEEEGGRLYDAGGRSGGREVEHFGFRDGVAVMRFLPPALHPSAARRNADLYPLRQVLVPLAGAEGAEQFGSFLVYRKLEQDVAAFDRQLGELAVAAYGDDSGLARERAGAWLMGRFRDGSPAVLHDRPVGDDTDDFTYRDPVDDAGRRGGGRRCPFHAHIRKMNPRGDHEPHEAIDPRARLPVRRSLSYGRRPLRGGDERVLDPGLLPEPGERVGMLFLAYVADLGAQFEHLVEHWANRGGFPHGAPADPLIGRTAASAVAVPLPDVAGAGRAGARPFAGTVRARGGVYLFAPPRSFFHQLAGSSAFSP